MKMSPRSRSVFAAAVLAAAAAILGIPTQAQQTTAKGKAAGGPNPTGYIGGTVQGEKGPEAGVWVIAETKDLATNFIKIVVTDDQGRFMLPELPNANYKVWVRGYGLADSTPVDGKPGATLNLKATNAKTPQEAAKVY